MVNQNEIIISDESGFPKLGWVEHILEQRYVPNIWAIFNDFLKWSITNKGMWNIKIMIKY